jgi:hypothetical protein
MWPYPDSTRILAVVRGLNRLELVGETVRHALDALSTMSGAGPEPASVDEAVLALLWLNAFEDHGQSRAWKTFDRAAMELLHGRGLISDPKSDAKSVALTDEGRRVAEQASQKMFGSTPREPSAPSTRTPPSSE